MPWRARAHTRARTHTQRQPHTHEHTHRQTTTHTHTHTHAQLRPADKPWQPNIILIINHVTILAFCLSSNQVSWQIQSDICILTIKSANYWRGRLNYSRWCRWDDSKHLMNETANPGCGWVGGWAGVSQALYVIPRNLRIIYYVMRRTNADFKTIKPSNRPLWL